MLVKQRQSKSCSVFIWAFLVFEPFYRAVGEQRKKKKRINGCFSVWEEPNSSMPDLLCNVHCTWERGRNVRWHHLQIAVVWVKWNCMGWESADLTELGCMGQCNRWGREECGGWMRTSAENQSPFSVILLGLRSCRQLRLWG